MKSVRDRLQEMIDVEQESCDEWAWTMRSEIRRGRPNGAFTATRIAASHAHRVLLLKKRCEELEGKC